MGSNSSAWREAAQRFLETHRTGVLATTSKKKVPHAATVDFVVHDDLSFYFITRVEARKYRNLTDNPVVAMAVTDENSLTTVQLTGKAKRVENLGDEQKLLIEIWELRFSDKNWPRPSSQMFRGGLTNELAVIRVRPSEMCYANFTSKKDGTYGSFFHKVI